MTRRLWRRVAFDALATAIVLCGVWPAAGAQQSSVVPLSIDAGMSGWAVGKARIGSVGGVLTVRGGGDWLRTERPIADFRFTGEARLSSDSEVAIFVRAWPTFDFKYPTRFDGARVLLGPHHDDPDAWHRFDVSVVGDTVRLVVDNEAQAPVAGVRNPQGFIALFVERGLADFRNVHLERVVKPPSSPPDGTIRPNEVGVSYPRPVKQARPLYTSGAMRRRIQGTVMLTSVVGADGIPRDIRVEQSLDPETGLDREAIAAFARWRFAPATRAGEAVPVFVFTEMTFTLR